MTEEERFWEQKEEQAASSFGTKKEDGGQKQYDLIIDNQVEFIKSDLMKGSLNDKPKSKKKKKDLSDSNSDKSDESMEESDFEALEKKLTPLERERLLLK